MIVKSDRKKVVKFFKKKKELRLRRNNNNHYWITAAKGTVRVPITCDVPICLVSSVSMMIWSRPTGHQPVDKFWLWWGVNRSFWELSRCVWVCVLIFDSFLWWLFDGFFMAFSVFSAVTSVILFDGWFISYFRNELYSHVNFFIIIIAYYDRRFWRVLNGPLNSQALAQSIFVFIFIWVVLVCWWWHRNLAYARWRFMPFLAHHHPLHW